PITILPLKENGPFPNNSKLPVLIYKDVFMFNDSNAAAITEQIFEANNWVNSWRNGIYDYQHYHSTAHEVLGVYEGWADVQIGGPGNDLVRIEKGDVIVLPAGTAHMRLASGNNFAIVGAYPDGQKWDMKYGEDNESDSSKKNIEKVPLPTNDPVYGLNG